MEVKAKKILKMEQGITLIALVITIIVLLILAGVAIATLTGENGVVTKANQAKENTELANAEERVKLAIMGSRNESNGLFDSNKFEEEIVKQNGNVTSREEDTIEVKIGNYEAIIDAITGEIIEIREMNSSKITIEKEITPAQEIYAPRKIIKLKAKNDEFGIESIKTPDGKSVDGDEATYTVTNSGNYTFMIKDGEGKETKKTIKVSNVSPTCALYDNGNTLCGEFYANNNKLDEGNWGGTRRIYIWKRLYGISITYKC